MRTRQSRVDQRCHSVRHSGGAVPEDLLTEQRQVYAQVKELAAQRKQLLAELAELRTESQLSQRLSQVKSRACARKHGMDLTRDEFDAAVAQLRQEQSTYDRARNWLDGTTPCAKEAGAALAAALASCHGPLSFDSNDW